MENDKAMKKLNKIFVWYKRKKGDTSFLEIKENKYIKQLVETITTTAVYRLWGKKVKMMIFKDEDLENHHLSTKQKFVDKWWGQTVPQPDSQPQKKKKK